MVLHSRDTEQLVDSNLHELFTTLDLLETELTGLQLDIHLLCGDDSFKLSNNNAMSKLRPKDRVVMQMRLHHLRDCIELVEAEITLYASQYDGWTRWYKERVIGRRGTLLHCRPNCPDGHDVLLWEVQYQLSGLSPRRLKSKVGDTAALCEKCWLSWLHSG